MASRNCNLFSIVHLVLDTLPGTVGQGAILQVIDDEGRQALLVDGAVQSVSIAGGRWRHGFSHGYWPAMLPPLRPRRALLLGYGGGTLAALLRARFGQVEIVGVDLEPELAEVGRDRLGLDPGPVELVQGDAIAYAASCREHFELVAVDLFQGHEPDLPSSPARSCAPSSG